MRRMIKLLVDGGIYEFPLYVDNREIAADVARGVLAIGAAILYHGMICEIMHNFIDFDGEQYTQMLPLQTLNEAQVVMDQGPYGFTFQGSNGNPSEGGPGANGWTVEFR